MMAMMTFSYLCSGEEDDVYNDDLTFVSGEGEDDYDAILYVFVFERRR